MTIAELRAVLDNITVDRLAPVETVRYRYVTNEYGKLLPEPVVERVDRVEHIGGRVIVFLEPR